MEIQVTLQVRPFDSFIKSVLEKGGSSTTDYFERTLYGACGFDLPKEGNLIKIYGAPGITTGKVTAKSGKEASQKISASPSLSLSIVSLGFSAEDTTTSSTGRDQEFPVEVIDKDASERFVLLLKVGQAPESVKKEDK